jgi:hypothetical protein
MKIPVWVKPGLWGAAAGAIAMAIIGFTQLGWTTSATAEQLAQERARTAVVAGFVSPLRGEGPARPDKTVLAKFQSETSSYSGSNMVMKAGWATLGNEKSPDDALARPF